MLFLTQSNNAYDVGGPEPLCLRTWLRIPANSNNNTSNSGDDLSLFDIDTTDNATQPQLVASCPSFLQSVDFTHLFDIDQDDSIILDNNHDNYFIYQGDKTVYPFELTWFDVDAVPPDFNLVNISARLMFCDAEWGNAALCHSLVDVKDWDKYRDDDAKQMVLDNNDNEDDEAMIIPTIPRSSRLATSPMFPLFQNPATVNFRLQGGLSKGLYYIVMHYAVLLETRDNSQSTSRVRWDVSTIWKEGPLYVESNPTILVISDAAKGFLFLVSVVTGMYALFCTLYCWRHRQHVVMSLAQAPFLILLSAASLGIFALQFLLLPTMDWHCRTAPVVLGTLDVLVVVILNARLWRAYQTLSTAGQLGVRQSSHEKDQTSKHSCCRICCCCCTCCSRFHWGEKIIKLFTFLSALPFRLTRQTANLRGSDLRRAVTNRETASLITVLMVPQFLAAILGGILEDLRIIFEFDKEKNTGRFVCDQQSGAGAFAGTYYAFLLMSALILSWMSRNLPSAFNEKNQMFQSTGLVIVIAIIAAALTGDTAQATTPPEEVLGVEASTYICSNLLILVFIVQPKIGLVWSGKKVVVSRLLQSQRTESELSEINVAAGRDSLGGARVPTTFPRVVLQMSDPFPRRAEVCMYSMLDLLRSVTQRSSKGRPIRKSEWKDLCDETARLAHWTNRIELDWDSEPVSNNVIPNYPAEEEAVQQAEETASASENHFSEMESHLRERLQRDNAGAQSDDDA